MPRPATPTPTPPKRGRGRPMLAPARLKTSLTLRLTPEQRAKLDRLCARTPGPPSPYTWVVARLIEQAPEP